MAANGSSKPTPCRSCRRCAAASTPHRPDTLSICRRNSANRIRSKHLATGFKRRCREAGIDADLSAHGLRKLAATICAERGATEAQLMALFGWTTAKQAALYTKKINRAKLEKEAAILLQTGNACFDPTRVEPPGDER